MKTATIMIGLAVLILTGTGVTVATTFDEALAAPQDDKYLMAGDGSTVNWSIMLEFPTPLQWPEYVWVHFQPSPSSINFAVQFYNESIPVGSPTALWSESGVFGPFSWPSGPINRMRIYQRQSAAAGVVYVDAVTNGSGSQPGAVCAHYLSHTGPLVAFPDNALPSANAGEDLTIQSAEQDVTIISGTASDPDDDPLQYRWLADGTEIMGWSDVVDGVATLSLEGSQPLGLGAHTLTLEVSDGTDTTSDSMTLTVINSLPYVQPSATAISVGVGMAFAIDTSVADFDGDTISYTWFKGSDVLASGSAQPPAGGDPVAIAPLTGTGGVAPFTVGSHTLTIVVSDGVNPEQSATVTVDVLDTTAPTLAPAASETMLWPPNNKLRSLTIQANATDDSGGPVTLTATVSSNEPDDGDCFVDSVDSITGVIELRLRAERSGHGDGRVYTVTITATDSSGNATTATVEITVPHDRRRR